LKTATSLRIVPVHPSLLTLGLLDFVKGRESVKGNLWGFTQWKGIWGKKFGNWYSMYFNRKHIEDTQKTFHSFRHTFTDTLKQAGVQDSLIAELVGHSNDSITMSRYGKRYLPKVLLEAIKVIDY
jgi:integrase